MEDTKALSPEVKGLIETIRNQAKEYSKAFEFLEIEKKEFERERNYFVNMAKKIRDDIDSQFIDIHKNIDETLGLIEFKTEQTTKIFDSLNEVMDLKNSLIQLNEHLKNQSLELDNLIIKTHTKSGVELENAIVQTKHKVEKELETLSSKLEIRVTLKLKQVESKLLSLENKIWALADKMTRDSSRMYEDIDNINEAVTSIRYAQKEQPNVNVIQIESTIDDVKFRYDALDSKVATLKKLFDEFIPQDQVKPEQYKSEIKTINQKLSAFGENTIKFHGKVTLSMVISIVSIIGVIIAIILAL